MSGNLDLSEEPVDESEFAPAEEILSRLVAAPHTRPIRQDQMSKTHISLSEIEQVIGPAIGFETSTDHHGLRRYNDGRLTVIDLGSVRA